MKNRTSNAGTTTGPYYTERPSEKEGKKKRKRRKEKHGDKNTNARPKQPESEEAKRLHGHERNGRI